MFSINLEPGEQLFKIYRQSEWALGKALLAIFAALYIPWFLLARADLFANFVLWFLAWTILVLLFGVNRYLLWLLNSYIVTDKRLISVEHPSLFKRRVADYQLGKISHISFATTGFFSSLLNFGTVEVKIDGLNEPVLLKNLRRPENLKTFLSALRSNQTEVS